MNLYKLIFHGSKTYLCPVLHGIPPMGAFPGIIKMIVAEMMFLFLQPLRKLTAGNGRHTIAHICTGCIQSHRIKAGKHTYIGNNRQVIFPVAITVWRDLSGYADMKTGSALYYRQGILSHTPAKQRVAGPVGVMNSIKSTLAHAVAASYALVSINVGFPVSKEMAFWAHQRAQV